MPISAFLSSEVTKKKDADFLIQALDDVLNGNKDDYFIEFNSLYIIFIEKEKTFFYRFLEDYNNNEILCEIETNEFRELINIWIEKLIEFKKTGTLG